jgi:hypothetical protein
VHQTLHLQHQAHQLFQQFHNEMLVRAEKTVLVAMETITMVITAMVSVTTTN